jgi:hypothetical protein
MNLLQLKLPSSTPTATASSLYNAFKSAEIFKVEKYAGLNKRWKISVSSDAVILVKKGVTSSIETSFPHTEEFDVIDIIVKSAGKGITLVFPEVSAETVVSLVDFLSSYHHSYHKSSGLRVDGLKEEEEKNDG